PGDLGRHSQGTSVGAIERELLGRRAPSPNPPPVYRGDRSGQLLRRPGAQAGDHGEEFGGFDGFDDVVLEAGEDGFHAVLGAGVGGEGDGGGAAAAVGGQGADAADEGVAVLAGHADVADQDVGAFGPDQVEGLGGGGGGEDDGAAVGEEAADHLAGIGLVV